jgi:hypothetical protein
MRRTLRLLTLGGLAGSLLAGFPGAAEARSVYYSGWRPIGAHDPAGRTNVAWHQAQLEGGRQATAAVLAHGGAHLPAGIMIFAYRWNGAVWETLGQVRAPIVPRSTAYYGFYLVNRHTEALYYQFFVDQADPPPPPPIVNPGGPGNPGGSGQPGKRVTIRPERTTYRPGEEIRVYFSGVSNAEAASAFLAVLPFDSIEWRRRYDYRFLNGATSGWLTFTAPASSFTFVMFGQQIDPPTEGNRLNSIAITIR